MRRRFQLLALSLLLFSSGCITVIAATTDNPINPSAVERLKAGTSTLPQVLEILGAPIEVHNHADGLLLVYRYRARNTFRLGISAGQITRFIDVSQVASEAIGNLSLTIQRIHQGEDRLIVLLDKAGVFQAAGLKISTNDLEWL